MLLPQPGRELCDVGGRVLADALENVDEIIEWIDLVQPTGRDQALDDANMLGAQLRPAEHPVFPTHRNRP